MAEPPPTARSQMHVAAVPGPVLVMGAGTIGCYLGGCLQAAGASVVLVGRPRVLDELRAHGLRCSDLEGRDFVVAAGDLQLTQVPPADASPALVLLCVKSAATVEAARALAEKLPSGTLVLSMQNGVANARDAAGAAPELRVRAGMVPFNVAEIGPGHYHRGTSGVLAVEDDAQLSAWLPVFAAAGVPLQLHRDLGRIQWAKLLLNLNNPLNALSGRPLRSQLLERDSRLCLAALQEEGLRAMRAAGIEPSRLTPLPPSWVPTLLRLPTPLFRVLAARMLRIDASARSSMADDFARGRPTEIDALCGEIVRLAERHGVAAPVNERLVELIGRAAADPRPWSGAELRRELGVD